MQSILTISDQPNTGLNLVQLTALFILLILTHSFTRCLSPLTTKTASKKDGLL